MFYKSRDPETAPEILCTRHMVASEVEATKELTCEN